MTGVAWPYVGWTGTGARRGRQFAGGPVAGIGGIYEGGRADIWVCQPRRLLSGVERVFPWQVPVDEVYSGKRNPILRVWGFHMKATECPTD